MSNKKDMDILVFSFDNKQTYKRYSAKDFPQHTTVDVYVGLGHIDDNGNIIADIQHDYTSPLFRNGKNLYVEDKPSNYSISCVAAGRGHGYCKITEGVTNSKKLISQRKREYIQRTEHQVINEHNAQVCRINSFINTANDEQLAQIEQLISTLS